jgi:hypothetical protein
MFIIGKLDILLWSVPLIKSGSLDWTWSTKIWSQFVTHIRQFIGQSDVKHIMMSPIKTITSRQTDIITNIPAHPIELAEILAIMSVSTFKIDVILYLSLQLTIRSVNQRLSRACIVHLVIKKNNWSYVKTMSCVILELRST